MGGRGSYVARAVIAVALFLGFYALALGLAGLLIWLPYAEWVYAGRIHARLAIGALICAFGILKGSIFVPAPRFTPPGPEIAEHDEPRLFALIRSVATEMKTAMPIHVYLIPDVNAFVTEVGGFMGIGSRRVMGVGVGLMSVDNVSELKATLAHEFGHYVGGDTRLGGFVYRTRAAIGRVLETLGSTWISKPFRLYATLFLRVSHGVSQKQELSADGASVRIAGKQAHVSGLEREGRAAVIFDSFLGAEVGPLVSCGFCAENLYEGFRVYSEELLSRGDVAKIDAELAARKTSPYDTHPALVDRVRYAKALPDSNVPLDDRPATSLLADPTATERRVSRHFADHVNGTAKLESVAWRDVAEKVYGPKLEEEGRLTALKVSRTLGGAASCTHAVRTLIARLRNFDAQTTALFLEPDLGRAPDETQRDVAPRIVARALGALLGACQIEAGGRWRSDIGKPHQVVIGDVVHEPFRIATEAVDTPQKLEELAALFASS